MRSAYAPVMSATVTMANVSWKMTCTLRGYVAPPGASACVGTSDSAPAESEPKTECRLYAPRDMPPVEKAML